MTNKDFYAFCRDQRKTETNEHKKAALQDVYGFMWECGTSKRGVWEYIKNQVWRLQSGLLPGGQPRIDAYNWLQAVFDGTVSVTEPSGTLF
jgi:hypothetical protein